MFAMDTKLGIIYCAISEYNSIYIFNSSSLKMKLIVMKPKEY